MRGQVVFLVSDIVASAWNAVWQRCLQLYDVRFGEYTCVGAWVITGGDARTFLRLQLFH